MIKSTGLKSTESMVITIDGPSGAGKGTIARLVAQKTGYSLLDSGALYRLTGLAAHRQQIELESEDKVEQVAATLDVEFKVQADGIQTVLAGEDVTKTIRTEEVGSYASIVAAHPKVRAALLDRQRDFAIPPGLIADGRDMGTVVFPDAPVKVFLTASAEERAKRRVKQLEESGLAADYTKILADIQARDERDSNRAAAPLIAADDALVLDSTSMSIDEVLKQVMNAVEQCVQFDES